MQLDSWRERATALLVMVAVLAGCTDGQPSSSGPQEGEPGVVSPTPTSPGPQASGTGEEEPATDRSDAGVHVIAVTITDGQAHTDSSRVDVAVGTIVRIEVRADVDDEVHVHGYDLLEPVSPADPGVLEFSADIPGVFEVEAEHAGVPLFQLRVR